jgi:hypothetical protein
MDSFEGLKTRHSRIVFSRTLNKPRNENRFRELYLGALTKSSLLITTFGMLNYYSPQDTQFFFTNQSVR